MSQSSRGLLGISSCVSEGEVDARIERPSGTVTFLLGDLEQSTVSWEAAPRAMAEAVDRFRTLVDSAVRDAGGFRPLEQGEGDSFVAAFDRASAAVAAAAVLQAAMGAEDWPGQLALRVRLAVHSGEAVLVGSGDYGGPVLNRCARIRDLGRGGQTLLSQATRNLAHDNVPAGYRVVDRGFHELRDLAVGEVVYELVEVAGAVDDRPLRSPRRTHNLPTYATEMFGRDAELATVSDMLATGRLVTLTGAGGSGKTRLAASAVAQVADSFAGGVWFVDFATVRDAEAVPAALAAAVGASTAFGRDPIDAAATVLGTARSLVVLDNCEHVVDECAAAADTLLRTCSTVTIVATTREPLGVPGELAWRVPSLGLPPDGVELAVDEVGASPAVALFVDRARLVRPNFSLDPHNVGVVVAICRRLDGMPLAIELAAATVRVLHPGQILAGLDDRFRLLGSGPRTALARQQTLRASVAWGVDLLADDERTLLGRLGVFVGGFDLDAAEAVGAATGEDRYAVLGLLTSLVDKSMVVADQDGDRTRFRLLETMRQYALENLLPSAEADAVRGRHRDHFVALATRAGVGVHTLAQAQWWAVLRAEQPNFHAALEFCRARDDIGPLADLVAYLGYFWGFDARVGDGQQWAEFALERCDELTLTQRHRVAFAAGFLYMLRGGAPSEVFATVARALAWAREDGDASGTAGCLQLLGWMAQFGGMPDAARSLFGEAIALSETMPRPLWLASALRGLGVVESWYGDAAVALELYERSSQVSAAQGDVRSVRECEYWIAWAYTSLGRLAEADAAFERYVPEARAAADDLNLVNLLCGWARTQGSRGEAERAQALADEAERVLARVPGVDALKVLVFGSQCMAAMARGDTPRLRARIEEWSTVKSESPSINARVAITESEALLAEGDVDGALECCRAGVAAARAPLEPEFLAVGLGQLSRIERARGEHDAAASAAYEALEVCFTNNVVLYLMDALVFLAGVLVDAGGDKDAARLLGAAAAGCERTGFVHMPSVRAEVEQTEAAARRTLGDEAFADAFEGGAALSLEDAVAFARRGRGERRRPVSGWDSLTPTEVDVVALVTKGLTNAQIAERLLMSRSTVKAHLAHIFTKLSVTSRTELAAVASAR